MLTKLISKLKGQSLSWRYKLVQFFRSQHSWSQWSCTSRCQTSPWSKDSYLAGSQGSVGGWASACPAKGKLGIEADIPVW